MSVLTRSQMLAASYKHPNEQLAPLSVARLALYQTAAAKLVFSSRLRGIEMRRRGCIHQALIKHGGSTAQQRVL